MLNPADSISQFQNSTEGTVGFDLPDELAVEILSRVPAVDVIRLRCVCKRWRDLTCSHDFTLLHLRRCVPMVLFDKYCFDEQGEFLGCDHFLWDQCWEPLQTTPKLYQFGKVSDFELVCSNGGLVVMKRSRDYMIMNPLYHEKVHITLSEEFRSGDICGVFFHPSLKEYCTLWRLTVSGDFTEYKILNMESKPCWIKINNPWSHLAKVLLVPPVLIDERLYWMVQPEADYRLGRSYPADIMEFDIRKEEFTFISFPVPGTYGNLLDTGGFLSVARTFQFEDPQFKKPFEVNIWTLKDHARKLWTLSSYRIYTDAFFNYRIPMALVNDELVLRDWRPIFTCNLKLGTVKVYGDDLNYGSACTHLMSLASLRNCNSKIYMDIKGEVEKEA